MHDVELNYAIRPTTTTIDDARFAGFGVLIEVKVMANQLHLVKRLIETHRFADVDLLAQLNRAVIIAADSCDVRGQGSFFALKRVVRYY